MLRALPGDRGGGGRGGGRGGAGGVGARPGAAPERGPAAPPPRARAGEEFPSIFHTKPGLGPLRRSRSGWRGPRRGPGEAAPRGPGRGGARHPDPAPDGRTRWGAPDACHRPGAPPQPPPSPPVRDRPSKKGSSGKMVRTARARAAGGNALVQKRVFFPGGGGPGLAIGAPSRAGGADTRVHKITPSAGPSEPSSGQTRAIRAKPLGVRAARGRDSLQAARWARGRRGARARSRKPPF